MELIHLPDNALLARTKELAVREREITISILHHLREIDSRRLYATLACSSLFDYCVRVLGYQEGQAQRRIAGARLLAEFPHLEDKVSAGVLSLSAICQAYSFFRREKTSSTQKLEILSKLESQSSRKCERILLSFSSNPEVPRERLRAVTESISELRIPLDENLLESLLRLKELWKCESFQEVVTKMAERALAKADPQASRALPPTSDVKVTRGRHVPAAVRRAVWVRDQGQCTFTDGKRACHSRYRLELDHIIPFAMGGPSTVENLRLRCFTHNQLHAIQTFGREKVIGRKRPH
ncbi:MAG: HNH endonuclease [Bacteriovoracia bacterium]